MSVSSGKFQGIQTWRPCGRAFFVYYVAMVIFFFGPQLNPDAGLSPRLGFILGSLVLAAVAYQWSQEYQMTATGLAKIWRWPARRHHISWENVGEIQVRHGLTQSLLRVGNLRIMDKTGGPEIFWFGLSHPKEIKAIIEANRP